MKYLISQDGKTEGPYNLGEINSKVQEGIFSQSDIAWAEGWESWQTLSDIDGFVPRKFSFQNPPEIPPHATPVTARDGSNSDSDKNCSTQPSASNIFTGIAGKVSQASGLERLEGFSISHLFSQVFRRHTPEEIEEHFSSGTIGTTPTLANVIPKWPTPWAFVRLLGLSMLSSIAFYWAIGRFNNPILIPGWIFVGCFGIPFAVLVFFLESNILKNVSFYRVMALLFMGGLLSLVVSLFLFEYTRLGSWMGAMSAGVIEESGKLLAVVLFTRKWPIFNWILNGMLFGAAVGTGFSAFESSGYVFVSLSSGEPLGAEATMTLRAFLSPFTHTIWTAIAAAALWRVKGENSFQWSMLADTRFIRIFGIVVFLHMLWNSPLALPILGGSTGYLALRLVIGLLGWIIILLLIQAGIKEVRLAQESQKLE